MIGRCAAEFSGVWVTSTASIATRVPPPYLPIEPFHVGKTQIVFAPQVADLGQVDSYLFRRENDFLLLKLRKVRGLVI